MGGGLLAGGLLAGGDDAGGLLAGGDDAGGLLGVSVGDLVGVGVFVAVGDFDEDDFPVALTLLPWLVGGTKPPSCVALADEPGM